MEHESHSKYLDRAFQPVLQEFVASTGVDLQTIDTRIPFVLGFTSPRAAEAVEFGMIDILNPPQGMENYSSTLQSALDLHSTGAILAVTEVQALKSSNESKYQARKSQIAPVLYPNSRPQPVSEIVIDGYCVAASLSLEVDPIDVVTVNTKRPRPGPAL